MKRWVLYIIECSDGSLYTGITTDLNKRIKSHNEGKASKYTRVRTPIKLEHIELFDSESQARKREAAIKNFPRQEKLKLFRRKRILRKKL